MDALEEQYTKVFPERGHQDIHVVAAHKNALQALTELRKRNILSLPVMDADARIVGLVDMIDMCAFMVGSLKGLKSLGEGPSSGEVPVTTVPLSLDELFVKELQHTNIMKLMNCSNVNHYYPLPSNASFVDILKALVKPGVHRVPVIRSEKSITHNLGKFITQSEILRFIRDNIDKLPEDFRKAKLDISVGESGIGTYTPITASENESVLDVFVRILKEEISGMPVVDANGVVVGNVSARDMRRVVESESPLAVTSKIIKEFKKSSDNLEEVVVATPQETLLNVVEKMCKNRIHRLCVVDENKHAKGVISITDVISALL